MWWNNSWITITVTCILYLKQVTAFGSSFSPRTQALLWTRRIQSQPTNTTYALDVIQEMVETTITSSIKEQEQPIMEALKVCGSCERPDLALKIYQQFPESERCRTMAIYVLGSCQQLTQALEVLKAAPPPNIGSYNAAIAACGKAKDWEQARQVYQMTVDRGIVTTCTCNTLFTVLAQRRQGVVALGIFSQMPCIPCIPDRLTYQYLVSALVRSGMAEKAHEVLEELKHSETSNIVATDAMYDMVFAAYSKDSNWEGAQQLERLRNPNNPSISSIGPTFQHWNSLEKIGRGKETYWELGTINLPDTGRITVGVHPNRNASKNGIKILFYENPDGKDDNPENRIKLGYLLMQNSNDKSFLLGMFLKGQRRGRGLSKVCLACWFWLCLKANVTCKTGKINKPLLSLLLHDHFGLEPSKKGGVEMELARDPDHPEQVLLYAPSRKNLAGAFSPWDLQHQNLRLLHEPPEPRGRMITVLTTFEVPPHHLPELRNRIQEILPDEAFECKLETASDFQSLFFGREV
jgi:pentatricopeptide repeat protein